MLCDAARELVCPADVPREQRDGKAAGLVNNHNSRVCRLAHQVRSDAAYGDANSAHKDEGVEAGEGLCTPGLEAPHGAYAVFAGKARGGRELGFIAALPDHARDAQRC